MLKNLILQSISYSVIRYFSAALAMIKTLIIAKYLGPEILGLYAIVIVLTEYLNYINLGVFFSMTRDVALDIEEGEPQKKIFNTMGTSLSFSLITCSFFLLICLGMFLNPHLFSEITIFPYLPHLFFLVLSYQLKHFVIRYLQVFDHFLFLGALELAAQIVNTLIVFIFIKKYSIDIVLISIIISNFVLVIAGFQKKSGFRLSFDYSLTKLLIYSGIPILLFNIFSLIISAIDRTMIAFFYKLDVSLGYYHLAYSLAFGLFIGFRSLSFLIQPRIFRRFKNREMHKINYKTIQRQTLYLETLLVLLSLLGIYFIAHVIRYFLSEYEISIRIMQFLLIALTINGISFFHTSYLIANQKQKILIPCLFLSILVAVIANFYSVELGYGLYGIAFSKVLTFGFYGLLIQYFLSSEFNRYFIKDYFLTYYRAILLFLPISIIVYKQLNILLGFVLFFVIYLPSLIKLYRNIIVKYVNIILARELHGKS